MWDAIIAGAGPAGAVSACVLARTGHRVLMLDATSSVRYEVGEALPGAAARLLHSLGLRVPERNGPHAEIGGNLSAWNADNLASTDFVCDPYGCGWRLDRARFDSALRDSAIRSGASLKSEQVAAIDRCDELWRLSLGNGETESGHWLIDATGRRSFVARKLGARRLIDTRLTAVYALGRTKRQIHLDRTIVEAVPQGWWYAARLPSGALIAGLHGRPQDAAHLARNLSAWLQALAQTRHIVRLFPDATFQRDLRTVDASGSRLNHFSDDGWVACGDAAMSLDPLSSQGLFAAIHGGIMAGRAIHSAILGSSTALTSYVERLEQVWQINSKRLREMYRSESRWPSHVFWSTVGSTTGSSS
jgi:flavin-dependent dehydrogenase